MSNQDSGSNSSEANQMDVSNGAGASSMEGSAAPTAAALEKERNLPLATFIELQPLTMSFWKIQPMKPAIQEILLSFNSLRKGETVSFQWNGESFEMRILDTQPQDEVKITEDMDMGSLTVTITQKLTEDILDDDEALDGFLEASSSADDVKFTIIEKNS